MLICWQIQQWRENSAEPYSFLLSVKNCSYVTSSVISPHVIINGVLLSSSRSGSVLVRDSNHSDWIYIIKSVFVVGSWLLKFRIWFDDLQHQKTISCSFSLLNTGKLSGVEKTKRSQVLSHAAQRQSCWIWKRWYVNISHFSYLIS